MIQLDFTLALAIISTIIAVVGWLYSRNKIAAAAGAAAERMKQYRKELDTLAAEVKSIKDGHAERDVATARIEERLNTVLERMADFGAKLDAIGKQIVDHLTEERRE